MFVNYTLQDNSVSNSCVIPDWALSGQLAILNLSSVCMSGFYVLLSVQLIRFQLSQFDFCPEYVERKPDNEIYIIVIQLYSVKYTSKMYTNISLCTHKNILIK